jgi:chromosome segregation ATPase
VWPAELAFGPAVAAVELARDQAADEVRRLHARTERLATEVEELGAQLADAAREAANAREDLARREQESARIVEWLKLLLAWAMRAVHGGEATEDHIAAVMQATDAEFGGAAQIAALGIRLSHQTTEMARLAEEADLSAAEAERLAREIAALRAEIERREPERAELAQLREAVAAQIAALATQTREAERANQQVRGLWQQLTARDGESARLRDQVAELEGVRQRVRELEPLRGQVAEFESVSIELADARLAAAALTPALAKVQDELSAASAAVAERDLYIESLRRQLATVERSRLWRAVRPLARLGRDAGAIFRR